jgi:hypothetical protein
MLEYEIFPAEVIRYAQQLDHTLRAMQQVYSYPPSADLVSLIHKDNDGNVVDKIQLDRKAFTRGAEGIAFRLAMRLKDLDCYDVAQDILAGYRSK